MANRNKHKKPDDYYPGCRHLKILIGWQYHRFMLSLRDVLEILLARKTQVSYETIREWNLKFGQTYTNEIKHRAPRRDDKWYMDETCIVMKGKKHWLWRAVDQDGFELAVFLQSHKSMESMARNCTEGKVCLKFGK